MNEAQPANIIAREAMEKWQEDLRENVYTSDTDLVHTIKYHFPNGFAAINAELEQFGKIVPTKLEALVAENQLANNLPRLESYNGIGERVFDIVHHPTYIEAGDIIYGSKLMAKMAKPGGLAEALSFFFYLRKLEKLDIIVRLLVQQGSFVF